MSMVLSIIARRMRAPLLVLITVYTISIVGLLLIPGTDEQGNVWHMSIFHAYYLVSYTATTVGFGEIPYPLNDGQHLWVLFIIYVTVISWFYLLGSIIAVIQNPMFKDAVTRTSFRKSIRSIVSPFYLVCGYGETANAVVTALSEENYRAVVIDKDIENLNQLLLNERQEYVPHITGDASDPAQLELAGIKLPMCKGVIALTPSDEVNLKIALTSKLLHPDINVVCKSEVKEFEDNMRSFGTEHIVNPFSTFSDIFAMAMHSPALHLLYEWLTGAPNTPLPDPVYMRYGHWVLCGYGRLGKLLYKQLQRDDITVTVIDPSQKSMDDFKNDSRERNDNFLKCSGFDEKSLADAGIESAAGVIAGSNNDSNNLSTIMTARSINPEIFVIARQNDLTNHGLYTATSPNLLMHPRDITASKIRAIFITPLLIDFLEEAASENQEWANIAVSRICGVVGELRPTIWSVTIDNNSAPAVMKGLGFGRSITIGHITHDPGARKITLKCVPLLVKRESQQFLMPAGNFEINPGDKILFCGGRDVKHTMNWTFNVMSSLNYIMTLAEEPESYFWRLYYRHKNKTERRGSQRPGKSSHKKPR